MKKWLNQLPFYLLAVYFFTIFLPNKTWSILVFYAVGLSIFLSILISIKEIPKTVKLFSRTPVFTLTLLVMNAAMFFAILFDFLSKKLLIKDSFVSILVFSIIAVLIGSIGLVYFWRFYDQKYILSRRWRQRSFKHKIILTLFFVFMFGILVWLG